MAGSEHEHLRNVQHYYNQTKMDYRWLWQGAKAQAIHFGYVTDARISVEDSLIEMNRQLACAVKIGKDDLVLDAGCGIGGSSCWIAQNRGARVHGISITPFQVEQATQTAKKRNLDHLVTFTQQDYEHTTFEDNSFTVIWFLESLVHALDKEAVLKEAQRVLKPNGRIVIADYTQTPNLTALEQSRMQPWWDSWSMPPLDTQAEYRNFLKSTGFEKIAIQDWSEYVAPSLQHLWQMSKIALPFAAIFYHLGLFSKTRFENVAGSVTQYETFAKNLWQYSVFTAVKKA
jgi:ubiquinone/menaquinone biosynthesis C-methylase UbiE